MIIFMKKITEVKRIAVVGAGTMGSGIAQLSAAAGYRTILYDLDEKSVTRGYDHIASNLRISVEKGKLSTDEAENTLELINTSWNFQDLTADVIIEAIIEKKEVKSELFTRLAVINDADTIFCSNTSSIPITDLAADIPHPERVVGMHFFNPAHLMKLVEVISGELTAAGNANLVFGLAEKMGKTPVRAKDAPGFIVNRIGKLYHTEPLSILEEGTATVETIDGLLEATGFKMGPFRLIDLIGVDANLNVTRSLYELMNSDPKFKPSPLQERMVQQGLLGRKSGKGFYEYRNETQK
jgi:3-hydroxybutyryl-CoA dehydrogenase